MNLSAKAFTDPLLFLLPLAIFLVIAGMRRTRGDHRPLFAALLALLALGALSLGIVSRLLYYSLLPEINPPRVAPDVIVVAAGSSFSNETVEIPSLDTTGRVLTAVEWWRRYPQARLILSGVSGSSEGARTETLRVMRRLAIREGVPPGKIELETRSTNTRTHAIELRKLRGVTRKTRVGVVTSDWHMRRALYSFRKHFDEVIPRPFSSGPLRPVVLNDFLPSSDALSVSTSMLQEWVGLAWYALRR